MERFYKPKTSSTGPNFVDLDNLPWDPVDRKRILDYHPDQRDEIRRKYWVNGPCQPRGHDFPNRMIGNRMRCFCSTWFDKYGNQGGRDVFSKKGYNCWNKSDRCDIHVGDVGSAHNKALKRCEDLVNQNQSIATALHKQDDLVKRANRLRLNAAINDCRHHLKNVLPFRGHDESKDSLCKGNYLETMDLILLHDKELSELPKAAGNNQYLSPTIQKDIANCFEEEVLSSIFKEIGDDVFALLVDESSDVSKKEQMAIVLRYVDARGLVKERFVGLVHVMETSSLALKFAIDNFFAKYGLSYKKLRGQGYDGANNMRGEFNGLKAKILEENKSAYYVHCFAHQLQLVVVTVARKNLGVVNFFDNISILMNVVCSSCKRTDILRENEKMRVEKQIGSGILETGSGLNQELSFIRPGDTRWNSHYKTLVRLVDMFPSIISVLEYVKDECSNPSSQNQAISMLDFLTSFEFVFYLHMMLHILGLTDVLSRALQRKDQDILEAILLVETTKVKLQEFRESGFDLLLEKVCLFCRKHDLQMVDMNEKYINDRGHRSKRKRWNDAGTYDAETSRGPNGSIRFELECSHRANNGLKIAIDLCEEVKSKHPRVTYADLYQLAGVVAVEMTGGPTINFVPGRKESTIIPFEGRLPDAKQGSSHLRDVFYRMGLSDKDIVALSSAHTLGKALPERSGFDEKPWTKDPLKFDNSYFVELLKGDTDELLKLPSDKALVEDPNLRCYVELYAKDQEAFFKDYVESHKKFSELGYFQPSISCPKSDGAAPVLMAKSVAGIVVVMMVILSFFY